MCDEEKGNNTNTWLVMILIKLWLVELDLEQTTGWIATQCSWRLFQVVTSNCDSWKRVKSRVESRVRSRGQWWWAGAGGILFLFLERRYWGVRATFTKLELWNKFQHGGNNENHVLIEYMTSLLGDFSGRSAPDLLNFRIVPWGTIVQCPSSAF